MALIEFKNLPDTSTPLKAENLNNNFNEAKKSLFDGVPLQLKILKTRNDTSEDVYFNVRYAFGHFEEMTESKAFNKLSKAEAESPLPKAKRAMV